MASHRASEARNEADRSFERLYLVHRSDVFRAALRELGNVHDAEDVTQAAFVDAYRAVLRGSQPESPRAWLLAIAENVRRRRFRTALRRPREEPLDLEAAPAAEPTTEEAEILRSSLAALPPQQRDVFLLREIAGLSYGEIAEQLGSTVGAVQMLLFRARQALRAELEPPPVTRLQRGIAIPLPGWLAGLATRSDHLTLTPRVAGLAGAVVLAATGATVGLADSPAHRPLPQAVHETAPPAPTSSEQPAKAAPVLAQPVAVPDRRAAKLLLRSAPAPAPAAPAARPAPTPGTAQIAPASPERQAEVAQPTPELTDPPRERRVPPLARLADAVPQLPVAPIVPVDSIVPVASVPLPPLLEEAGAAAVAVVDEPPLPALPLDTLPPVP